MYDEIKILILRKEKYKVTALEDGTIKVYPQPKDESERINDILIEKNGKRNLLFRIEEPELTFFLTSKCNQLCIMCPKNLILILLTMT